ncbi:MAG: methionyl-tRNA formyltransferase [bacterium]|nr:methionyl-tRNA formyltransferase [bacterium]
MKIIFFGASRFVIPIIELLRKKFDLVLVVTTEKLPTDPVLSYCNKHSIQYISASSLSDPILKSKIINLPAGKAGLKSNLGILAYFGLILPQDVLNIFPKGILNIHPSLIPKYRGPTPVQTAILNGDKKTGVTIIKLDEKLDHGPILAQVEEPILANDTAETLHEKLFKIGAQLLNKNIDQYLEGNLKPKEQEHTKTTYTKSLERSDGYIDFNPQSPQYPKSSQYLNRMIRAYYPWPGVWTKIRIRNHESRIMFLPGKKLQVEGKKPMSYKDFINGYPNAKGVIEKFI